MKKFLLKPGFELIFSLSLIVILGLPPVLFAQTKKDVDIKIQDGDTTVNGINIKSLSPADRQSALTDIRHLKEKMDSGPRWSKRRDTIGHQFRKGEHRPQILSDNTFIRKDSAGNIIVERFKAQGSRMGFKDRDETSDKMGLRDRGPEWRSKNSMSRFDRRNSQTFEYNTIDKDGISTHLSFRVSEASNDDLKRMPHVEGPKFEINDLNLVPEFSTGKTLLMFNLPVKTVAEVKLSDSEGNLLWSEKSTNGTFMKTFSLGLNGLYYLQIKQGNNISVKRIMKDE